MRMLANRQVFRETEYGSDVFVNNRMSSILLSSHEKNLRGFIGHWYEYNPQPSFMSSTPPLHRSDDGYRSADSTLKAFRPENAKKSIWEVHHGITLWDHFGRPEGAVARERGNRAMVGAEPILHGGLIYDYNWTKHGESATIVDVGAGMGGAAIELTRKFPKLRVIMQDKPEVIESAKKVCPNRNLEGGNKLNEHHFIVLGNQRAGMSTSSSNGSARLLLPPAPLYLATPLPSESLLPPLCLTRLVRGRLYQDPEEHSGRDS